MTQNSKPTYKHIKEIIIKYLKQYQDIYGNEIYLNESYKKSNKPNKGS
jgi:hypothetical protein